MKVSKSLLIGGLSFRYAPRIRPALGLIVSKHYGNSVSRNIFKRRCRALFRDRLISNGVDVALIVRPKKQNLSFTDMDFAFREFYENIFT